MELPRTSPWNHKLATFASQTCGLRPVNLWFSDCSATALSPKDKKRTLGMEARKFVEGAFSLHYCCINPQFSCYLKQILLYLH